MDKSVIMLFVISVRWHCIISMKTTRLNEDIDRAVRGVCDIRPESTKMQFCNRNFIAQKKNIYPGRLMVLMDWQRYLNN